MLTALVRQLEEYEKYQHSREIDTANGQFSPFQRQNTITVTAVRVGVICY